MVLHFFNYSIKLRDLSKLYVINVVFEILTSDKMLKTNTESRYLTHVLLVDFIKLAIENKVKYEGTTVKQNVVTLCR